MPVKEWTGPPPFGGEAQIVFGAYRQQTTVGEHQTSSAPPVPISLVERWDFDEPTFETPLDPLD